MAEVSRRLKDLRESANPSLTVRQIAEMLGMSRSAYHFYESEKGFKQRFLPMEFARRVAAILADRGVEPAGVMALAGVAAAQTTPLDLTADESQLLDEFRRMAPAARRSYLHVGRMMNGTPTPTSGEVFREPRKGGEDRPAAR